MAALPGELHERGGPAEAYVKRPWTTVVAVTWGVLVVVVAVLGLTARRVDSPWAVFGVAVPLGVVVALRSRWFHRGPPASEGEARFRLLIPVGVFGIGVWLFVIWAILDHADAWFYAAASTCLLAISQLTSEIRLRPGSPRRSKWLAGHLAAPLAIGVAGLFSGVSGADVLATVIAIFGFSVVLGLEGERAIVRERPGVERHWPLAILLLLVGATWLAATDLNWFGVLAVGGFLVLLVGAIVTNTDLDALAGVAILAFGLSLTPAIADEDLEPVVHDGDEVMVAFGDSYISGEGAEEYLRGTNNPIGNHCRRAPTAYPLVASAQGGPGIPESILTVACSGAKANQVYRDPQNAGEPIDGPAGGLSQVANLERQLTELHDDVDIDLVVVSIGGNDAGFGDIGKTCVAPGDCTEVMQGFFDNLANVDREVGLAYTAINGLLRDDAADDPDGWPHVVAVPYPRPFGAGRCGEVPLTARERATLNAFVEQLDAVIERRAQAAGFGYLAEMQDVLDDEGLALCDSGARGLNFLGFSSVDGTLAERINPTNWIHNSFHPNPLGHEAMAGALRRYAAQLDGEGTDREPPEDAEPKEPYVTFELSSVHPGEEFVHCTTAAAEVVTEAPIECRPSSWWQRAALGELLWAFTGLLLVVAGAWVLWVDLARERREQRRKAAAA